MFEGASGEDVAVAAAPVAVLGSERGAVIAGQSASGLFTAGAA
jgi:hypothetical protein